LFEFLISKLAEFGRRADHNGTAVRTAVLVAEIVFVAQEILGQEDVRGRATASAKAGCSLRRSIVRTFTPKKDATSSSVHCSAQSFSTCSKSI
jgi:hypothetical protein